MSDVWQEIHKHDVLSTTVKEDESGGALNKKAKLFDVFLPESECSVKPEPFQSFGPQGDGLNTSDSSDELIPVFLQQSDIKKHCVIDKFVKTDSGKERVLLIINKEESSREMRSLTKK